MPDANAPVALKYYAALTRALREEMRRDPTVVLIGEDVGVGGGMFAQTKGLFAEFGPLRVRDTPIAEAAFTTMAVGAAATGLRPVVEIGFEDFLTACMDGLVNQAAKLRYMLGGQVRVPLTVYAFGGGGVQAGPQHSQCLASWFMNTAGLKVVVPATPRDVLGLVKSAIRDDNPVLVLLGKQLVGTREDCESEAEEVLVPLGHASIRRVGSDVTIVAIGQMVPQALAAAKLLADEGLQAEVIDPRTLSPLDFPTISASVTKTGRLVIVHEAMLPCGPGAEILALVAERLPDALRAAPVRVTPPFTPSPFAPNLEQAYRPDARRIASAARTTLHGPPQ
jgi:pyruvate dehydrogenase E1 component beta subunit